MRVLTQWHNSRATCSGSRSRRASASVFETKVLWGELFHVVTHCKKRDRAQSKVRARICVSVCVCVEEDRKGGGGCC